MYKLLLILKYLRRKLAPLFAAAAVTLCTAMVVIVISVMGGFLEMMRASVQTLTGQITIQSDIVGFAYYEELRAELEKLDEVRATTPMLRVPALLKLDEMVTPVEVAGIDGPSYDGVTKFSSTLYWKPEHLKTQNLDRWTTLLDAAGTFEPLEELDNLPLIVPGIEIRPSNTRDGEGKYDFAYSGFGQWATLTILPLSKTGNLGAFGPEVQKFVIANEFKSGLYDVDKNRVFVRFDVLQKMLKMEPLDTEKIDPETGEPTGEKVHEPGRTHEIMVAGREGVELQVLRNAVQQVVDRFMAEHKDMRFITVETWRERHRVLLGAVEKEKGMLVFLFAIISLVAIVMVAVIFYMIVLEKTRDIGTLRAIGASRSGIASIFMGYGVAIGLVGAVLGLALAAAIVWNLNEIQDQLHAWFGFKMWDPRVYYFERIPNRIDPWEAGIIFVCAVLSSVLGSIVPAALAARLNPVEALRYE